MALEHEIALLGQRMGIANLALSPAGLLAFDVEGMGRVHFELVADGRAEGEMLIYLSRPVPDYDRSAPQRLLELAHYDKNHAFPLGSGLHNGQAVLLTRLPERQTTAATMENAVSWLARQMDGIIKA